MLTLVLHCSKLVFELHAFTIHRTDLKSGHYNNFLNEVSLKPKWIKKPTIHRLSRMLKKKNGWIQIH
jgi:hypothetical protein